MLMFQKWRSLLAMHWEAEPETLRRMLPPELELDLYRGKAYVTTTPFTMPVARPRFVPRIPFATSSHEVNVRTYVTCNGEDSGIWFLSLDASNLLAVAGARAALGMPYYPAKIQLRYRQKIETPKIDFRMQRIGTLDKEKKPIRFHVSYTPQGEIYRPALDSLDSFLMDRYVIYTTHFGLLLKVRIDHEPWRLQNAAVHLHRQGLLPACGVTPIGKPFAVYGGGVDTKVTRIEPVTTTGVLAHPVIQDLQSRISRSAKEAIA